MKLLGTLGFTISIKGQALFRSVSQPFLDRKAIAPGLRNLLALFVEKHFIDEAFGFTAAQRLGAPARFDAAVGLVLAIHFIIDVQRYPAHGPIYLPSPFRAALTDNKLNPFPLTLQPDQPTLGLSH